MFFFQFFFLFHSPSRGTLPSLSPHPSLPHSLSPPPPSRPHPLSTPQKTHTNYYPNNWDNLRATPPPQSSSINNIKCEPESVCLRLSQTPMRLLRWGHRRIFIGGFNYLSYLSTASSEGNRKGKRGIWVGLLFYASSGEGEEKGRSLFSGVFIS